MARKLKPLTPPPSPSEGRGLGEKIANTLRNAFHFVYSNTVGDISDRIRKGFDDWLEEVEQAYAPLVSGACDELLDNPQTPEWIKPLLRKAKQPTSQIEIGAVAAVLVGMAYAIITSGFAPFGEVIAAWFRGVVRPARVDPGTGWPVIWRNSELRDAMMRSMRQAGWFDDVIEGTGEAMRPRLSPGDLWRYMFLAEGEGLDIRAELKKQGYTDTDMGRMLELVKFRPSPADLVSMGVREAWRDDVARKWGYDADFPSDFAEWMRRQGDTENWSQKYWRAHWNLPSVTMGMEMLHRGIISEAEFDELLRISDIPAGWRERIIKIAYSTLTRVDVRRMHAMGVLTAEDVYQNYRDFGYDDKNATRMTEFTVRYNTEEDREATKTDVVKAYQKGILTRDEAVLYLRELNYTDDWAEYYIAIVDLEREEDLVNEQVSAVETLFVEGEITESRVYERLGGLGFTAKRIAILLEEWEVKRLKKLSRPTKSELETFYRRGIITDDRFKTELKKRAYPDEYIEWFYRDLLLELEEEAIEAETKARDEEEAVKERAIKTDYDIARAEIDVKIAELKRQKAEDKLLALTDITPEQVELLAKDIKAIDLEIAEYNKSKAELRVEYLER